MDTRSALKKGTILNLDREYRIIRELARGGSCIVYDAAYTDQVGEEKMVRIKECYPYGSGICRDASGFLSAETEEERRCLEKAAEKARRAYCLGNELFRTEEMTNLIVNTTDIFTYGSTVYVVSAYTGGKTLSLLREEGYPDQKLQECFALVRMTALAIKKIHKKGYLYLDSKPENILVLNTPVPMVQFFDFDTLMPDQPETGIADWTADGWYGTRGFSAPEQRQGKKRKIGRHSDVYGIGALLYDLLFGKTAGAADEEADAVYDYSSLKTGDRILPDRLFFQLTDFFHHTLAGCIQDRWPDMQKVIPALEALEETAGMEPPQLMKTRLPRRKRIYGRTPEFAFLDQWFSREKGSCLVVTGMGGIGKSTLIRQYLADRENRFDSIVYVNYRGNVAKTVLDGIQISDLEKNEKESSQEYLERKLAALHRLSEGKQNVLAVDEFIWKDGESLQPLFDIAWKVLLITRERNPFPEYDTLCVGQIQDREEVYALFSGYLGRGISAEEIPEVERIVRAVSGHTLLLELIAKQIRNSHLSVEEAASGIRRLGIFGIGSERVETARDFVCCHGTIREIISGLFDVSQLRETAECVLVCLSLFGTYGIEVGQLAELMQLKTKEEINKLISGGWVAEEEERLTVHPVIAETVLQWKMKPQALRSIREVLRILAERLESGRGDSKDLEAAEYFQEGCRKRKELQQERNYRELLYQVILALPREKEEERMGKAEEWLELCPIRAVPALGVHDGNESAEKEQKLLNVCEILLEILWEQKRLTESKAILYRAETLLGKSRNPSVRAQLSYLWVGYYDTRLDGHYDALTKEEKKNLSGLLTAVDQSIRYMRKVKKGEEGRLGEYLRCKALVLIRNGCTDTGDIRKLLRTVKETIRESGADGTRLQRDYFMTCAWYYTYVEEDGQRAGSLLKKAYKISVKITSNDLDFIDEVLSPAANICLECGQRKEAVRWLELAVKKCSRFPEIKAYRRKREELEEHLRWCEF